MYFFWSCPLITILAKKFKYIWSVQFDIECNWIANETKIYISIVHFKYHNIQFFYFASHQLFIACMGNEVSENRAAAKESS